MLITAFPQNWESTIKEANPEGFYESQLRNGIYFATNPNPKTPEKNPLFLNESEKSGSRK